jgi:Na+-transporting NADH:ubiquinone oxidoreductase subunit B
VFQKQAAMRRVLIALAPIALYAVYLYGLRLLLVAAVVFPLGVGVEYFMEKKRGKPVSEAVLVTCALYSLSMPPAAPLWIVGAGILFAVFMAKEVYGGFGRNVFNPAVAGRLFVYVSFALAMQSSFPTPAFWPFFPADAVSAATPLAALRAGAPADWLPLVLGFRAGSFGEGCAPLIALAGVYLLATKTANFRLMLGTLGSGLALTLALFFAGAPRALPPESLLAGSFLFVAVFMATDPVSAPKKPLAQWLYGLVIGLAVVLIRTYALFPEGTSFAVLLGNTAASWFDELAAAKPAKPAAAKPASAAPPAAAAPGAPAGEEASK